MRLPEIRNRRLVFGAIAVMVMAVAAGVFLIHKFAGSRDTPISLAHEASPHSGLERKLVELESGLKKGLSPDQMLEFASAIQEEIQKQPLPEDDDLQFSGELVVKYLRELANIEIYRRASIAKKGYDPLDPNGKQPNHEMIELQRKYSSWL